MISSLGRGASLTQFILLLSAFSACSAQPPVTRDSTQPPPPPPQVTAPTPNGTVTSGGGLIYGAKANPWFVGGQISPTWCVEIDLKTFGMSRSKAESIVELALHEWKAVSKVEFTKSECSSATDLRFLLGSLTPEDRGHLSHAGFASDKSLRETAALTIQTNYDSINLIGRGFIYVSPESGPLRISGGNVSNTPWNRLDGKLLKLTVLHELGHVFGFPHTSEADGLMGSRTIEYLTEQTFVTELEHDVHARANFDDLLANMLPVSLVDFPQASAFEHCQAVSCTRVVLSRVSNQSLKVEIFKAAVATHQFWGKAAFFQLSSSVVIEKTTEPVAVSKIFDDGIYLPGIIGIKSTFVGQTEDRMPLFVIWQAGKTPLVMSVSQDQITTYME